MSYMEIDKQGVITHTGKSKKHQVLIDESSNKLCLNVPAKEKKDHVWLGGTGKNGKLYGAIAVFGPSGLTPMVNGMGKWKDEDD